MTGSLRTGRGPRRRGFPSSGAALTRGRQGSPRRFGQGEQCCESWNRDECADGQERHRAMGCADHRCRFAPDYGPPFVPGTALADAEGNVWLRPTPPVPLSASPGAVYDVIGPAGTLIDGPDPTDALGGRVRTGRRLPHVTGGSRHRARSRADPVAYRGDRGPTARCGREAARAPIK